MNEPLNLQQKLKRYSARAKNVSTVQLEGKLVRMVGLTLEAVGCDAAIGSRCLVASSSGDFIETEVVGFAGDKTYLMPTGSTQGLAPGARIQVTDQVTEIHVGEELLGRVIDGAGEILDDGLPIKTEQKRSLYNKPLNPLKRTPIQQPLDVGIRAINSMLTIGRGQRIGLFAGSGVGKSVLLGMMTRYTNADVVVVGLIGERGREVQEFIQQSLGEEGLRRSVVVATPADTSPLSRIHGALRATAIAEYFRDQGKHVLLLMDSLTRFAMAQRELGLAIGEPPTTKGYPPSVFAKLPQLVERAGTSTTGSGSITGLYTVLMEGDDHNDPVVDSARAILDGHIMLSRQLAEEGQYPAIDIEKSISRVMPAVVSSEHRSLAIALKRMYSRYQQSKDLINVGAYVAGNDLELDEAIAKMPTIRHFLAQDVGQSVDFTSSYNELKRLFQ